MNENLPKPKVTLWDSKQLASLMANEILHHLSDENFVKGWRYQHDHGVMTSEKNYTIITFKKGFTLLRTRDRVMYESDVYNLWEFESTLGVLGKPEKRPTFSSLLKSDAIFQAIYYDEWPDVVK
jgi:hypothetical protein